MPKLLHEVEPRFPSEVEVEKPDVTFSQNWSTYTDLVGNRWEGFGDMFTDEDEFTPVEGFNIRSEEHSYLFEGLSGNAKSDLLDAEPESPQEAAYYAQRFQERDKLSLKLAQDGGLAWMLASEIVTPEGAVAAAASVALEFGTAGLATPALASTWLGRGAVALRSSNTALRSAEVVAAEAGYAAGTAAFNQAVNYSEMTDNALIGLGIGSTFVGVPKAYRSLAEARKTNPNNTRSFSSAFANDVKNSKNTDATAWMPTIHKKLKTSNSQVLRDVADKVFTNSVVTRNGVEQFAAADTAKQAFFEGLTRRTSRNISTSFSKLLKEEGIGKLQFKKQQLRFQQLNHELYEHFVVNERTLDEIASPDVRAIAESILGSNGLTGEALKYAQKAGLRGAEGLQHSMNYAPRRWTRERISDLKSRFSNATVNANTQKALKEAIIKGYARKGATLPDNDIVNAMARAVWRRASSVQRGFNSANDIDADDLATMLRDVDADEELIERAVAQLRDKTGDKENPAVSSLGRRIPMDLSVRIEGLDDGLRIADLMDKNVFELSTRYASTMMGAAELAKRGIDPTDIQTLRNQAMEQLSESGVPEDEIKQLMTIFDRGLGDVLGRPLAESADMVGEKTRRNLFRVRQLASIMQLGGMGAAAIPESSAMVARTGFLQAVANMPIIRNWTAGNRKVLAEEFEKMGVYFDNPRFDNMFSQYEEGLDASVSGFDSFLTAAMTGKFGLVNMSGLGALNSWGRKNAFTGFADDVFNQALGKRRKRSVKRQELGMDEKDWRKLMKYMRNSQVETKGFMGKTMKHFDMEKWIDKDGELDTELIDKFAAGLNKATNSVILRQTVGERIPILEGSIMQLLMQYRNMMVASADKVLHTTLVNPKDFATWANMVGGTIGAFVAAEVKVAMKSAGATGEKYEERADYLSPVYNLKQAFESGDTEGLAKSLSYALGYDPNLGALIEVASLFSAVTMGTDLGGRRADVSSSLLAIPSAGIFETPFKTARKYIETGEVSAQDVARSLPLGNTLAVMMTANTIDRAFDN